METIVGTSVTRVDALEKVKGAAIFGADLTLSGMLYGATLRSPYAHARIISIDVSEAEKLPGVRVIATGADLPRVLAGEACRDMPFLAQGKVRYVGDPVAAVAADDDATAMKAVKLIKVVYEELPLVLDAVKAMEKDAPIIHEDLANYKCVGVVKPVPNSNILTVNEYRKGDVEQGFQESDYVFEDVFRTQTVQHAALEPHAAVAQVDAAGRLLVWAPNDSPHRLRKDLGDALNMPLHRIRCISTFVGGGFGAKGGLKAEPIAIALAFKANHRPIKVVFTREEVFQATLVRHATVVTIKTGVKKDGTLVAREVKIIWDTGAYAEKGPFVCSQATTAAAGPYRIPHVHLTGYCVYTNKVVAGAYRGYGTPQIAWAYESQMDMIAKKLGMDPLEIRLKNVLKEGDINPVGYPVHSVGVAECLKQVAKAFDWAERDRRPHRTPEGKYRGMGLSCATKNTKAPSGSGAVLYLNQDGRLSIVTASVEVGQGMRTAMAQIVSEVLGISVADMSFSEPDTDVTPFDSSTTSSRTTFHMGNAMKMAAEDVKNQLANLGAYVYACTSEEVLVANGKVWKASEPDKAMSYAEVMLHQFGAGSSIVGRAFFYPPSAQGKPLFGSPSVFWMYAAHAVEVEVDPGTGKVEVKRLIAGVDAGRAINPTNCMQQIEGGALHAIGTAILEEVRLDAKGRMLNPNFHDYTIPTALDGPEQIQAILVEAPHREGPFGAKGIGEIVTTPVAAAIANAIEDATGVRIQELPLNSDRVLAALRDAGLSN